MKKIAVNNLLSDNYREIEVALKNHFEVVDFKDAHEILFVFEFEDDEEYNMYPVEVMQKNVHELEILCKNANKENKIVILFSPIFYKNPQNIYQLSVMLAEDLVKKYNEKNIIWREVPD